MTIFVSFYTSEYKTRAMRLRSSLEHHGLKFSIRRRDFSGSFIDITNRKAEFLMEMREEFPGERVVWMDADLVVYQYPALLVEGNASDWDIAYTLRESTVYGDGFVSGLVGIGTGPMVVHFLNAWQKNSLRDTVGTRGMVDDQTFERAARRVGGLKRLVLPPSYYWHWKYLDHNDGKVIGNPAA